MKINFSETKTNLELIWGFCESPWGRAVIVLHEDCICFLGFPKGDSSCVLKYLQSRFKNSQLVQSDERIGVYSERLFKDEFSVNSVVFLLMGTPFQHKVWKALIALESGKWVTYSEIAEEINHPSAIRAVGTAIGKNPISLFVPCHRVIPKSGGVGQYAWGSELKEKLLAFEKRHR